MYTCLAFTQSVIRLDILYKHVSTDKKCYKDKEIGFPGDFYAEQTPTKIPMACILITT
jgi:hypothetical protein